jgi:uncharacterized protein (TIGR02145 family)
MKTLLKLLIIPIILLGCEKEETPENEVVKQEIKYGYVTDYDGNTYRTFVVGGKEWMVENLRTWHYADGENILATKYLGLDSLSIKVFGLLYHDAIVRDKFIIIKGWHIPTSEEWSGFINDLGGDSLICKNNIMFNDTFDTQLGGAKYQSHNGFGNLAVHGYYWSSTAYINNNNNPCIDVLSLSRQSISIYSWTDWYITSTDVKRIQDWDELFSVRLVKD